MRVKGLRKLGKRLVCIKKAILWGFWVLPEPKLVSTTIYLGMEYLGYFYQLSKNIVGSQLKLVLGQGSIQKLRSQDEVGTLWFLL